MAVYLVHQRHTHHVVLLLLECERLRGELQNIGFWLSNIFEMYQWYWTIMWAEVYSHSHQLKIYLIMTCKFLVSTKVRLLLVLFMGLSFTSWFHSLLDLVHISPSYCTTLWASSLYLCLLTSSVFTYLICVSHFIISSPLCCVHKQYAMICLLDSWSLATACQGE